MKTKKSGSLLHKMMGYLIPLISIVFVLVIGYVTNSSRVTLLEDTQKRTDAVAEKYANSISMQLNNDAQITKGVAESLVAFDNYEDEKGLDVLKKIIGNVMINHADFVSFWVNFELNYIEKDYKKNHGRVSTTFIRYPNGRLDIKVDTMEVNSVNENSFYNRVKKAKKETLVNPSYFSFTGNPKDEVLKTTYCVPLFHEDKFVGLAGVDLDLNRYQNIIIEIEEKSEGYAFLVANNGTIFTHPEKELAGKKISEIYGEIDKAFDVSQSIELGKQFSFSFKHPKTSDESFYSFVPISIGNSSSKWSIGYVVPFKSINQKAKQIVFRASIFGLIGILILVFAVYLISRRIINPLKTTTNVINKLSRGEVENVEISLNNSDDEIAEMSLSLKQLIKGLIGSSEFAKSIGEGNLNVEYEMLSEKDVFGQSLIEMRDNLLEAKNKEVQRNLEIDRQNWFSKGEATFGEILRRNSNDIFKLSEEIVRFIIDYLGAIQGAIFIKNNEEGEEVLYTLNTAIAYSREKTMESKFRLGEGLIGRCAFEKLSIYMEDVPNDYVHITSGLGESNPRCILLIPAIINDEVHAVIEIVSFIRFESFQIEFVEKMGESIASTIGNVNNAEHTRKLLEQTKMQAEEVAAQEEEMRQNMEELKATQEEMERLQAVDGKKMDEALLEIEMRTNTFQNVLDGVTMPLFVWSADGEVIFSNSTFGGIQFKEVRKNIEEGIIVVKSTNEKVALKLSSILEGNKDTSYETIFQVEEADLVYWVDFKCIDVETIEERALMGYFRIK